MKSNIPEYLLQTSVSGNVRRKGAKFTFPDTTILNTAKAVKSIYLQAENSEAETFIQKINPHIKLLSLIYFIVIISFANNIYSQMAASAFILSLFVGSKLRISEVYRKIILLAFIFGFIVILPASLNIITPGEILFNVIRSDRPSHFWIYNIPQNIGITTNGIRVVALFFLRVFNSISFAMLIVYTTPFPSFVKSLKIVGIPDTFLMIISLTYKYIFILSRTIEETYFAFKSRLYGNIRNRKIRKLVSGRIFFIYKRSQLIYEGTYSAMVSRGFQGSLKLHTETRLKFTDVLSLITIIVAGIAIILI